MPCTEWNMETVNSLSHSSIGVSIKPVVNYVLRQCFYAHAGMDVTVLKA